MFDDNKNRYSDRLFSRLMGIPSRQWLYIFTAIATVLGMQLLYLVNDDLALNAGLSLAIFAGFAFSYYLYPGHQRYAIYLLDIAAIAIFAYYVQEVVAKPLTWGTEFGILLGILITLYSFRAFTERDHKMILSACLVIMLLASVASFDVKLMFILPIFAFSAFASLYVANNISLADRIPYIASEMGAGANIAYLAGRATIIVFVASILIYMVVPHSEGVRNPRFRLPTSTVLNEEGDENIPESEREELDKMSDTSGFSDQFNLSGGRIEIKDVPVLLVKTSSNEYMRGKVFDLYDGLNWTQSDIANRRPIAKESQDDSTQSASNLMGNVESFPLIDFPSKSKSKELERKFIYVETANIFSSPALDENPYLNYSIQHLDVTFERNDLAIFFSPYQPYRIEDIAGTKSNVPDRRRYADPKIDGFSILSPRRGADDVKYFPKGMGYKLFVLKPNVVPSRLKTASNSVPQQIRDAYTVLPQIVTGNEALVNLAETVAKGPANKQALLPYDKVINIYDYFVNSGEFLYSLDYPKLPVKEETDPETGEIIEVPEVDAAYHFCFETKQGYCEYFANAFAVFCRINDIPARIVTGYAPGTYNFLKNGYIYSTKNAHAWVEIYFDGFGWIAFDPTPASSDFLSVGELRNFFSEIFDFIQNLFVIDPRGAQQAIASFFVLLARRIYEVAIENQVTSFGILTALFTFLVWKWWQRLPKRVPPRIPKNEIVAAYYEVEKALTERNFERPAHMTGRVYLKNIGRMLRALAEPLKELDAIYYKYAYGKDVPSEDEIIRVKEIESFVIKFFEKGGQDGA